MPRVPCPLPSGTYPGASLPMSLAPSLLTPLTAALKIPAQSFIRAKTSPKYGVRGANAAWRATKTWSRLQQQQVANALGKNTKKWTSIEQPPARYMLSTSSSLGTLESPVSYEEISQTKKAQGLWKWSVCRTPKFSASLPSVPTIQAILLNIQKISCLLEPATLHSWFIEHSTSLPNTILSTSALSSFFNHWQLLLYWGDRKHLYRLLQGRNVTARNLVQQDSSQRCSYLQCCLQYCRAICKKKIAMHCIPYSKDRVFSELTL